MQQNILDGLVEICSSNKDFRQYRLDRYIRFIDSRQNRTIPENISVARHHILPVSYIEKLKKREVDFEIPSRSYKNRSNIALLTKREHVIAHWMLARISLCYSMSKALNRTCLGQDVREFVSSVTFKIALNEVNGLRMPKSARQKLSEKRKGIPLTESHKAAIAEGGKGRKASKTHRENISKGLLGKPKSVEHRENLSGVRSEKACANMRKACQARPTVQCPHCQRTGKGPNMTRFHFDKCKLKP